MTNDIRSFIAIMEGSEIGKLDEDGIIVQGVNTTCDVGPNEIATQTAKFGNDVDAGGIPKRMLGESTHYFQDPDEPHKWWVSTSRNGVSQPLQGPHFSEEEAAAAANLIGDLDNGGDQSPWANMEMKGVKPPREIDRTDPFEGADIESLDAIYEEIMQEEDGPSDDSPLPKPIALKDRPKLDGKYAALFSKKAR